MPTLFESERLSFSKMNPESFDDFCAMDMDAEVMKYYTSRKHGTREDAMASFQRYMDYHQNFPHLGGFMVHDKKTKQFIGLGVLIHMELKTDQNNFEVGYRLPVENWNKGYATEICKTLINYGFKEIGLEQIFGTTNPDNIASQRVLLKCGLKTIGTTPHYGGSTSFLIKRI